MRMLRLFWYEIKKGNRSNFPCSKIIHACFSRVKCLLEKYHKYLATVCQMLFVLFRFVNNQRDFLVYIILSYAFIGTFRNSQPRCYIKKGVQKNFAKYTGKHLCQSLFFNKKDTPTQVFSSEYCEIFKITIFIEHIGTTASILYTFHVKC